VSDDAEDTGIGYEGFEVGCVFVVRILAEMRTELLRNEGCTLLLRV
jgi:hypothetical protein